MFFCESFLNVSFVKTWEGGTEARMTKLTAAIQKLLTVCPKFVTFSFYLYNMFSPNFSEVRQSGACCRLFLIEMSKKF